MLTFPLKFPAIPVKQPIGTFYVCAIQAEVLLRVCYSERLQAVKTRDDRYRLEGTQRALMEKRLMEIANYIDTPESAFPNSIILAANSRPSVATELPDQEVGDEIEWKIELEDGGLKLVIPTEAKLAAIIDGQHRLFAYSHTPKDHFDDQLVCSVFFDLPKPVQAYLFATINSKQRAVDKSQTYELFGYNLDDVPQDQWDPDKFGVYIARMLNSEPDSPARGHITIAAANDIVRSKTEAREQGEWLVSLATFVQGIVRLISSNSAKDAEWLHRNEKGRRNDLLTAGRRDESVLRDLYLSGNDGTIYKVVKNYFSAVSTELFTDATPRSYINRTVGVQALFDVLRRLIVEGREAGTLSEEFFRNRLALARHIDFANNFFQASGKGRTRIRNTLMIALGLEQLTSVRDPTERQSYEQVLAPQTG